MRLERHAVALDPALIGGNDAARRGLAYRIFVGDHGIDADG